ncbi:vacuolar protein sorting-associated protein 16 homolog [Prorops nasuta]|uniref:vacuolar protein sorting-associated protein 16 homolog n=1 Tax=Prorops nasuta TaxID=863751 RepID=UPI0034CD0301
MSAMLTADWFPLGRDVYFRKFELYSLSFQHEVSSNNLLVAAPYGGSIVITRNPKKLVKIQGTNKPIVLLYSSSGKLTAKFQWSSGQLVKLGWSIREDLLCVQDDGNVSIYDLFGIYQHTFSMANDTKGIKVIDAKFFKTSNGSGVAILTSAIKVLFVNNVAEPKVRKIDLPRYGPIDSWCVMHRERETTVILSNQEGIYVIHQNAVQSQNSVAILFNNLYTNNKVNSVIAMSVANNNEYIALFSDTGILYIGSVDLKQKYCECNTFITDPLTNLEWCGMDAVVCSWDSTVMVVGKASEGRNETIIYTYDGPVHLVTEIDGVRVISSSCHEMIQKVPNVVQKIFRINSTDPASYLLEASKQFMKKSHKADGYIDLVKGKLDEAVKACIDGAGHEFDFETQKLLMRAAKFGKGFSTTTNPDYYVNMCRTLKVLNAVRHPAVGIPLTYTQFSVLTSQVLLDRLVIRRHYYLSIQIARHLQLPEVDGESRILAQWACYKVKQTQLDKEQIAEEIADKLGYAPGVSYSEIAKRAADCGRKQLAIKLIDYEPRASKQVPLLLTLEEQRPALNKAVDSGDTDLVYTVILHLRETMFLGNFQMFIKHCPLAMALYIKYCQSHNRETLRDIYNQNDDFHSQAIWFITESYQKKNTASRDALLQSAQENFKHARNDTNASLTEEQIKLLRYQRTIEETLSIVSSNETIVGESLHDTVKFLLMKNELKHADKLRSELKVPDRRYWWLRIQCLADNDSWEELDKFSKSKKSPIGYEPFIDQCLKYNKTSEAKKYLPRVKDDLKIKYFVKLKMLNEAAQTAIEQKDKAGLTFVLSQCDSSEKQLIAKITAVISSLKH